MTNEAPASDKAEKRERANAAQREAEYAKARRGSALERWRARASKWWYEANSNDRSLYAFSRSSAVRRTAMRLSEWVWFDRVVLGTIAANCLTLALYAPMEGRDSAWNKSLEIAEFAFTGIFTLEFFTLVVAKNFFFGPLDSDVYLRDGWRVLDFAVVVGGWVSLGMLAAGQSGSGITALRAIRALRPLRSIGGFPGLRIFVTTTLSSMWMVLDVIIFLLVVIAVFGILGVQRFSGRLSKRCAFDSTLDVAIDEAELPCSNATGGRHCSSGLVCVATDAPGLEGGFSTFNNILGATLIIYRVFTLRGWADLMYGIIDGTGDRTFAFIYFILLICIGAVLAQSFMLSVVTTKYKQSALLDEQSAPDDVPKKEPENLKKNRSSLYRSHTVRVSYGARIKALFDRPIAYFRSESWYQAPLKKFITRPSFENTITAAIVINTLILAVQYRGMDRLVETTLTNLNIALLSVFVLELLLKVLALGISGYCADPYNVFDALVVTAGLVEVFFRNSSLAVARAFRLLRVLRVTRLASRSKSMRRLIDATTDGFSAIISFTALLFIFVFVFTVLGMQLFGGTAVFYDVRPNFNTFGDSFMSVFEILTGSHWYTLMLIAMSGSSGGAAAAFFIVWSFLGSFVLLNLIMGMLVDKFSQSKARLEKELALLAEVEKQKRDAEAEEMRISEVKALTSFSDKAVGAEIRAGIRSDSVVDPAVNDVSTSKQMCIEDVRRHPDAKRVMERIRVRKHRKFAREVRLIESWLDDTGLNAGDESESGSDVDGDAGSGKDTLKRERDATIEADELDDGLPEGSMTAVMSEKLTAKVDSFVQVGVPIPADERQVQSSYRRWKIDTAAERDGSDSDQEMMYVVNTDVSNAGYGNSKAEETAQNLRATALNDLRRDILNQDRRTVNKEALNWATQARSKQVVKSAVAQLHPKEQTAIVAQRRAEGRITGQLGKFKGEGIDSLGTSVVAEAEKLSAEMKLAEIEARNKSRVIPEGESERLQESISPAPSSAAPKTDGEPGWRLKLKQKGGIGARRSSIIESLKSFDDGPKPGPVTESYEPKELDTLSNSQSARTPRNSSFISRSEMTSDLREQYQTLLPVVEHTEMPEAMGVDYSLPRTSDDLRAAKVRKAMGLPVRDIVIDQNKLRKAEFSIDDDDENWMMNPGASNDPECMKYVSLGFIKPNNMIRRLIFMVIQHRSFELLMLAMIVFSCVQLALDAPNVSPTSTLSLVLKAADVSFTLIFLCEAIIKIIAMGFVMHPGAYLRSFANCFDLFIVVVSLLVETINAHSLRVMRSFRLFRALRPLRLLTRLKSMQLIIATLIHVLPDLGGVLLLGLFQFLIFAILGAQFFSGKYDYCNDPSVLGKSSCIGTFVDSKGVHLSREWLHPPLNFDNTLVAFLTLFVVVTRDGWLEIAFQGMDVNGIDMQPVRNKRGWYAIYFVLFMLTVSFVWISMIVAIICEHYRKASELSGSDAALTDEQKEWAEVLRMKRHEAELARFEDDFGGAAPRFFIRKLAYRLVTHPRFETFIIFCIIGNTITMASYHESQPAVYEEIQRNGNIAFASVFILELVLKLVALFPARYFKEPWNVFDFIVVVASIPDLVGINFVGTSILRVLRLGRVLRLFKKAKGLRAIFATCVLAMVSIFQVIFLIFMLMFVYAVLGMTLFQDYETKTMTGRNENFRDFGASLAVLFRVITRDNWKRTMFDTMECAYDVDGIAANCTRVVVPALFFVTFILMGSYVLVSLITAAILEKFTEAAIEEGLLSTANLFTTVRRKLLLDMFSMKLKLRLAQEKALSKGRSVQSSFGRKRDNKEKKR